MSTSTAKSLISYETLVHAISGACGSMSAMMVTIPLDTVRTRVLLEDKCSDVKKIQGDKTRTTWATFVEIIKEEGIYSLFRGTGSTLQCVALSNFMYFYCFHGLKRIVGKQNQSTLKDLMFSCTAGVFNVILTNPFWVVNTRIKMQGVNKSQDVKSTPYKGLIDGLIKILRSEGIQGLMNGLAPSLMLVSNPVIKFSVYEFMKRKVLEIHPENLSQLDVGQSFFIGVIASLCATIITYPIQVVQTTLRNGHRFKHLRRDPNFLQMTLYILRNFGVPYLYKGLDVKLLQSVIAAGFLFLTYEQLSTLIFRGFGISSKAGGH